MRKIKKVLPWAVADLAIITASYLASLSIRTKTLPDSSQTWMFIGLAAFLTFSMLYAFGVYQRLWHQTSGRYVSVLIQAVGLATFFIVIINIMIRPRPLPLTVTFFGSVLSLVSIVAIRYRSRLFSGASWRWRAIWFAELPASEVKTRVLIVGAGELGNTLAMRLAVSRNGNPYKVVGFVDNDPTKLDMIVEGVRVLGKIENIPYIAEEHQVELIAIALPTVSGAEFRKILSYCEQTSARIKIIPDFVSLLEGKDKVALLRDIRSEDLIGRSPIHQQVGIDMSPITHKVILVTGAAGSIGSELVHQIIQYQPKKLLILDNNESGLHDLFVDLTAKYKGIDIKYILADVTNYIDLMNVFKMYPIQVVFHAAAYKHVPVLEIYPSLSFRVNVNGTCQLAKLASENQVERFVFISTDKAVNPSSIMGLSKRLGEFILHAFSHQPEQQTLFTSVRFGNVLGSRGSVIPIFERQIEQGGPVTVTDAAMTRFFMSISEAVNLVLHAACMTQGDDIFVLRMGDEVRIIDIAERLIRLRGLRPYKDIEIEFTGKRDGEKLYEELFSGVETPTDTAHPHVFKLDRWGNNFDVGSFWKSLSELREENLRDAETTINRFNAVIDSAHKQIVIDLN